MNAITRQQSSRQSNDRSFRQRLFRTEANDTLPLPVTHDRIYILPRRRGWAFLAALLIILVASINYGLSLGYALCFLLTGLFAATLLATYRNMAGVKLHSVADADAVAGEPLLFDAVLTGKNPHSEHIDIELHGERCYARADVHAGSRTKLELLRPTDTRGVQPLGRLTIESDYPLGLWRSWAYIHAPVVGYVSPQPENQPPEPPAASSTPEQQPDGLTDTTATTTHGEFAGIRPYRAGDSTAAIAWKQLARGTGLHTREFHPEHSPDRLSLSWEQTNALSDTEARLSRLAAWIHMAHRTARPYTLDLGPYAHLSTNASDSESNTATDGTSEEITEQQALRQLAAFGITDLSSGTA